MKKLMLCSFFPPKIVPFMRYCGKYCRAGQATGDSIIRRMRIGCCVTKAANTHSECAIIVALPRQQWCRERAPVPPLYVLRLSCLL